MKAAAIMNYWRATAFFASLGSDGPGSSGSSVAEPTHSVGLSTLKTLKNKNFF